MLLSDSVCERNAGRHAITFNFPTIVMSTTATCKLEPEGQCPRIS